MKYLAPILLVATLIAWAGSQGGSSVGTLPVFALCALVAFAINWLAFIPAFKLQTERFYDLTGSITYLTCTSTALLLSGGADLRTWLLAGCIIIWALRLGSFLAMRVHKHGDSRFDVIKPNFSRFLIAWSLQGLWVLLTAGAALAAITTEARVDMGWIGILGLAVWILGFAIEVIADRQKSAFRSKNRTGFISSGLWAYSRHPNYVGEIVLWTGVAILAFPALSGWQLLTLISPIFVYYLLSQVSGVNMLEEAADKRWGQDPDYQAYKARTPVLFPWQ